jgi:glutaryl-CoA dehydrogenase (non-decarboxylating)
MDFDLSDEHQAVEEAVRDWAAGEVAPKIHDLDREHRFERSFLKGMADLHLLGICIPEQYGGAGMDYISPGLVSEELSTWIPTCA